MNRAEFVKMLEHTLLYPTSTEDEVVRECAIAADLNVGVMVVQPHFAERVVKELKGSSVRTAAVLSFPHGCDLTDVKMTAAARLRDRGIDEIDMVINIGQLKDGDIEAVEEDIRNVVEAVPDCIVKVIIETCLLSDEEKKLACRAAEAAGAAFVKTSTGFSTGGATVADVKLMKDAVGSKMRVKASGGIRTADFAEELILAGADRIGASKSVEICRGK